MLGLQNSHCRYSGRVVSAVLETYWSRGSSPWERNKPANNPYRHMRRKSSWQQQKHEQRRPEPEHKQQQEEEEQHQHPMRLPCPSASHTCGP